jgi:DnaK suppressor protein
MLTHYKKAEFKKLLEQHLEMLSQTSDHSYSTHDFKDQNADPIDRASAELITSQSFRFRERDSNLIRKIQKALEKLEDGTFGVCEECENLISEKRLQARPITTLCIKCKEKQEEYEKLFGT